MTTILEQTNCDWHTHLEQLYARFLFNLTALELDKAGICWLCYKDSLQKHMDFEDEFVVILGNNIDGKHQQLIAGDHKILQRLISRIDPSLQKLKGAESQRLMMIEQLDDYLKIRNVLKHHDRREVMEFYPALIETCSAETITQVGKHMAEEFNSMVH